MASGLTPTTGSNLLKQVYSPTVTEKTIAKGGSPMFATIAHDRDGEGSLYVQPTIDSDAPSGSADFATAQDSGNTATLHANQFQVGFKPIYTTFSVSNAAIVQSMGQKGSWGPLLKRASESGIRMNAHVMSNLLMGTGFGEIGVIDASTTLGAPVITLKDIGHAPRFMRNMKLVLANQAANGALRNSGAVGYVQSVDYQTGKVTVSAAPNASSGTNITAIWAAAQTGDFICMAGCTDGSGTVTVPVGWRGWNPDVNNRPGGSDSFNNVNRSVNPYFLAGYYVDATSGSMAIQDAISKAAQWLVSMTGGKNLRCFINPTRWNQLSVAQQGQVRYTDVKGREASILFKALSVSVSGTEVEVVPDRYLGLAECSVMDPSSFAYKSVQGQLGTFMDQGDGLVLCRQASDPGVEGRIWSHGNFVGKDPSLMANILFPNT